MTALCILVYGRLTNRPETERKRKLEELKIVYICKMDLHFRSDGIKIPKKLLNIPVPKC